jgi:RNA polymerase sigma-70 factor (ECF subfamily)
MAFTVVDGRITGIAALTDPARLASMDLPDPGESPPKPQRPPG